MPIKIIKKRPAPEGGYFRSDEKVPGYEYTLAELLLIIAAGVYEFRQTQLMSCATYDLMCKAYQEQWGEEERNITGFDPSTGMWVHDTMTPKLERLMDRCIEVCREEKTQLYHTYIARILRIEP